MLYQDRRVSLQGSAISMRGNGLNSKRMKYPGRSHRDENFKVAGKSGSGRPEDFEQECLLYPNNLQTLARYISVNV